jgi:formylglycine-generating enzyme required for sulfatase activity
LNGGRGLANLGGDAGLAYETGWVTSDDGNVAPTNANLMCATYSSTWTPLAGTQENLPINCVNWPEAYAFCIWDGGFLPSEAEWEYAAAGGSQQRDYPWGTAAPGTANQYAIYGCYYLSGSGSCAGLTTSAIAPVGTATAGAGLWGQLDLAGNVGEWTMDWFADYASPSTDAANLNASSYRVTRGAYFESAMSDLVSTYRTFLTPSGLGSNYDGFRCARTP